MRKRYYAVVFLLIIGHLATELHSALYWLNPKLATTLVDDWFVSPPTDLKGLSFLWYTKMVEDSFVFVAILLAGTCQAYSRTYTTYMEWQRYSFRLYVIWCIYFGYHIFDFVMFFYNYKTSYWLYMVALVLVTGLTLFVAFFRHKRTP